MKNVMLPNVLFVGPPRTGTTWIWEYLRSREDVALPENVKETWFFSSMFHHGIDWYASHFNPKSGQTLICEVDPTLFVHPEAPVRVRELLGADVFCVVTVRDPVQRSLSHYWHARRYGWTKEAFEQAITKIPVIIEASRYSKFIPLWTSVLGEKRVAFLSYEALTRDPLEFTRQICSLLELQYIAPSEALLSNKVNAGRGVRSMILMRFLQRIIKQMRVLRLYSLLEDAKSIGLQKLLYKPLDKQNFLSQEAEKILSDALADEFVFLATLSFGHGLPGRATRLVDR